MYRMAVAPWYKLSCNAKEQQGSKAARDCPFLIRPEDEVHPVHVRVLKQQTRPDRGWNETPVPCQTLPCAHTAPAA